jgi:TonB family protein
MRMIRHLAVALGYMFTCACGFSQSVLSVDEQTILQNVDHRVDPVYPPIARAARITGAVVLNITVGAKGTVESIKVVSGPPMLQQAALDCVKQWTFKPFNKDGSPGEASGKLTINFDLGKDNPTPQEDEIASRYFPASEKCRTALSARDNSLTAADLCQHAAEIAQEFGPDRRFIEKRSAFVSAAWALANNAQFDKALTFAQDAVDVVKLGHDDNSGSSAVYFVLAVVEGDKRDFANADRDLTTAEDFERKGIEWAESVKFEHLDSYKWSLSQELQLHARLLQTLNRPADAQKKLDEAVNLK